MTSNKKNKQLPFRYNEDELEPYFKELYKLQYATKKNEALTSALIIAGSLIQKILKENPKLKDRWDERYELSKLLILATDNKDLGRLI